MKEDSRLWLAFKNGDRSAFEQIYRDQIAMLINYGHRFTSDLSLIEDTIQELFINIWKNRVNLAETDSIKKYLLGSFRNNIIRNIKKNQKTELKEDFSDDNFQASLSIEEILVQSDMDEERAARLKKEFEYLSPRQKEVIYHKYYQQMDNESICELMDISYQSLRNLLSTAIKRLRKQMT